MRDKADRSHGIGGTYASVEPFHLFRYVDELAFRYNNRLPMSDVERFSYLLRKVIGKRLTYEQLIGKERSPYLLPQGRSQIRQASFRAKTCGPCAPNRLSRVNSLSPGRPTECECVSLWEASPD